MLDAVEHDHRRGPGEAGADRLARRLPGKPFEPQLTEQLAKQCVGVIERLCVDPHDRPVHPGPCHLAGHRRLADTTGTDDRAPTHAGEAGRHTAHVIVAAEQARAEGHRPTVLVTENRPAGPIRAARPALTPTDNLREFTDDATSRNADDDTTRYTRPKGTEVSDKASTPDRP